VSDFLLLDCGNWLSVENYNKCKKIQKFPTAFGKLSQAKSPEVSHNYHSITEGALSNSLL